MENTKLLVRNDRDRVLNVWDRVSNCWVVVVHDNKMERNWKENKDKGFQIRDLRVYLQVKARLFTAESAIGAMFDKRQCKNHIIGFDG